MKQRSITKPVHVVLFTDEDTGCHRDNLLPSILIGAGLKVECFEKLFNRGIEDNEWLSFCGNKGWIAVTKDKRIRFQDASTIALVESNTRVLTLIGDWPHKELAINLVNSIYVLERIVKQEKPPCILKLHMAAPPARKTGRAGKVEVYRNHAQLNAKYSQLKNA